VLLLPAAGGVEVDQGGGDLFYLAGALGADVTDGVADDLVAHDELVAAIFEDQSGAMRGVRGGSRGRILLA
jgi:hypothetical protein